MCVPCIGGVDRGPTSIMALVGAHGACACSRVHGVALRMREAVSLLCCHGALIASAIPSAAFKISRPQLRARNLVSVGASVPGAVLKGGVA